MSAKARARWGYHELADHWAYRLVSQAGIRRGDLVLDVGAGTGAITSQLLKAGARVIAVELNPQRAQILRQRFASSVLVIQADAADLRLPRRAFRVVANPPFGITTAIMRRLLGPRSQMVTADMLLPAHSAARWVGARGPGGARYSRKYELRIAARFPSSAFRPPCPVAVSVLRVEVLS